MARGIGGEGGARGGRDPNAGSKTGGLGGGGQGQDKKKKESELTTKEREIMNKSLSGFAGFAGTGGKAPKASDPIGGDIGAGAKSLARDAAARDKTPNALPPGLNPLKYGTNPTPSYEATPSNLAKVVGSLIGLSGPGMIAKVGLSDELGIADELGLPSSGFESPTGPTSTGDYDKSEVTNASTGNTTSSLGTTGQQGKMKGKSSPAKKPPKPGFTLLKGVGGTLIGT
jgi:hypothetical protein